MVTDKVTLQQLNDFTQAQFTERLADIFEHSPWVAEQTWANRPFSNIEALHAAMCAILANADSAAQLQLIRAHPQLAGKAAISGELTAASTQEQHAAGLNQCSPEEFAQITQLNAAYNDKFGFPYILCVRGHTRRSIIVDMTARINNTRVAEISEALRQIEHIAAFRLAGKITSTNTL